MSRGTANLFTSRTPFSDVSRTFGGLMILEKSYLQEKPGTSSCSP
jgi:hypothetical protein